MCAAAKAEAAAREEAGNDYEGNDAFSDGEGSPEPPPHGTLQLLHFESCHLSSFSGWIPGSWHSSWRLSWD